MLHQLNKVPEKTSFTHGTRVVTAERYLHAVLDARCVFSTLIGRGGKREEAWTREEEEEGELPRKPPPFPADEFLSPQTKGLKCSAYRLRLRAEKYPAHDPLATPAI